MNPDDVIYRGKYIWHRPKNEKNKRDHDGLSFEEGIEAFDDPFAVEEYDTDNSVTEDRYNITGKVDSRWLVVTVTWSPRGELIRVISAREADPIEKEAYNENVRNSIG
ncbi:MAG: BrnT family toxin [Spirochaetaceae bacterium]|jgi:uncharacterized DUF497 family protein|nr:BrnT family toxin [Spirochaetaceae bacterium]